jgi:alkyl hydroperoxide reductase subunit AhpC
LADLQLNLASFKAANAQVLGISVDHIWSHQAFGNSLGGVTYPLLADFHPHGEVTRQYGLWRPERGNGKRALFVIDEAGVVRWSQVIERGWPGVDEVLKQLESL